MNIKAKNSSITLKQFIFSLVIASMCIYIFVNYMFVQSLNITYKTVEEVIVSDTMTFLQYTFGKGSYISAMKYYFIAIPIIAIIIGCVESLVQKKLKTIINLSLASIGAIISGLTWLDLSLQVSKEVFSHSGYYGTKPNVGWYLGLIFFVLLALYYLVSLLISLPKKEKKALYSMQASENASIDEEKAEINETSENIKEDEIKE